MLGRFSAPDELSPDVFEGSPTLPLRTLNGRLSRLPPNTDEGASARTDAFVSRECLRRRLDEDASVRTDALSVRALFAVALL